MKRGGDFSIFVHLTVIVNFGMGRRENWATKNENAQLGQTMNQHCSLDFWIATKFFSFSLQYDTLPQQFLCQYVNGSRI